MPQEPDSMMIDAARAHREGRLDEANRLAREVLAAQPRNLEALLLTGIVGAKQRNARIAIPALTQVIERDPTCSPAALWLSIVFRGIGHPLDALKMAEKAAESGEDQAQVLNQLGLCRMDVKNLAGAAESFRRCAELEPTVGAFQTNLGAALDGLGRVEEAVVAFRKAIASDRNQFETVQRAGWSKMNALDYPTAVEYGKLLVEADPTAAAAHLLVALGLVGLNEPAAAEEHVNVVLKMDPNRVEALTLRGTILQLLGRQEDARRELERSITLEPKQGTAYYALVRSRKIGPEDTPLVDQMRRAARDPLLADWHHGDLEYALGKAFADRADFRTAMEYYNLANKHVRERRFGTNQFDSKQFAKDADFTIQTFTHELLDRHRSVRSSSDVPIFIVGMIRSGTTLIEQILSCHPDVGAGGEQRFWSDHRADAFNVERTDIDSDRLKELEEQYLQLLEAIAPGNPHVTDKMPGNYAHLGLIHLAFPQARIIHMRRNPIDTCLSIWATPNSTRVDWANDKKGIVFAYREYMRLMDHWRALLPADRFIEVQYEELVADSEAQSRKLVEFCGLEWNDACLKPEENKRTVITPSDWQVRQPIYKSAVERWRDFEPWLGEFKELMTEAG